MQTTIILESSMDFFLKIYRILFRLRRENLNEISIFDTYQTHRLNYDLTPEYI